MLYKWLIIRSKARLQAHGIDTDVTPSFRVFDDGADWMRKALGVDKASVRPGRYTFYGLLKYGISISLMLASAYVLVTLNIALAPLTVLVFYWAELHFLFLFPLLIDGVRNPLKTSLRATYRVGLWRAIVNVIPIGAYMLSGLFNFRDPFKRWHIGCMCIIIWYCNEVRDRV